MATEAKNKEKAANTAGNDGHVHVEGAQSQDIDCGEALVSWQAWDKRPEPHSTRWYIGFTVLWVGLIAYALLTSNPLFALVLVMMGVMFLMNSLKPAEAVEYHITTRGVVIGHRLFEYDEIKDFSIVYKPPYANTLYLDFKALHLPLRDIPLGDLNPLEIRDALLPVLNENLQREEELLTDLLQRVYKL